VITSRSKKVKPMQYTKRSFVTLDGLRGIAAFAIVTRHAKIYFESVSVNPDINISSYTIGPFFESYLAVDFFFVLSGFVLAHAYGERLTGKMSAIDFMKVRIVRLYPLYFVALIWSVPLIVLTLFSNGFTTAFNFMFALMFLPSAASMTVLYPFNEPAWSLFYELIANAGFGIMWRRTKGRALIPIVIIAAIVLTISVPTGMLGFRSGSGAMDAGANWQSIGAGFARVAYSFFVGVLIYQIWMFRKPPISVSPFIMGAILCVMLASHPLNQYQTAYDLTATLVVFPLLVWLGASSIASGFTARVFSLLGAVSFGVYVLQVPLYRLTVLVLGKINPEGVDDLGWVWGVCFIVFVFVTALILDRYFDRPIRKLISSRMFRTSATGPERDREADGKHPV
jgi:peptidoglycan/LPS O-acetylase OafA/YrhL